MVGVGSEAAPGPLPEYFSCCISYLLLHKLISLKSTNQTNSDYLMVSAGQVSAYSLAGCFWLRVSQEAAIKVSPGLQKPLLPFHSCGCWSAASNLCWLLPETVLCHTDISTGQLAPMRASEGERERERERPRQKQVFL